VSLTTAMTGETNKAKTPGRREGDEIHSERDTFILREVTTTHPD